MTDDGDKSSPKRESEDQGAMPSRQQVENALRTLIDAVVPQEGEGPAGAQRRGKTRRKR